MTGPSSLGSAASHYDRVTDAWSVVLGDDLHYGLFPNGDEDLAVATSNLTAEMEQAADPQSGQHVLDVGCGTGATACLLAERHDVTVTGISTSAVGIDRARARAMQRGIDDKCHFEVRNGMDNGFPDQAFDVVWVLESSHLMRRRDQLASECHRVARPGARVVLCDVMLRRQVPFDEVRRLREPLMLVREAFGDARMEPLNAYETLMADAGLIVDRTTDLTALARPTLDRWAENAHAHRASVDSKIGDEARRQFLEATDVLAGLWDDGMLGYGLLAAHRPTHDSS